MTGLCAPDGGYDLETLAVRVKLFERAVLAGDMALAPVLDATYREVLAILGRAGAARRVVAS